MNVGWIPLLMALAPAARAGLLPEGAFSDRAAGTTAAAFLRLPSGSRHEAMGGAAAAYSRGSEALFWNPAGLARLEAEAPADLTLSYNRFFETTYSGAMAYARPLGGHGVIGAGLVYFSQSALTSYNSLGDPTGSFRPYDMAVSLGFARRFDRLLVGGAAKLIRSSLADATGGGLALDAGVQWLHAAELGDGAVDVGGSASQLGPPMQLGGSSAPLPLLLKAGALWRASPVLNAALDVNLPVDADPYVSLGFEGCYRQPEWRGFLRLGFNQQTTRGVEGLAGITGGAGLDLRRFRLDYAWVPFGDLGSTNRVTLAFRF